MAVKLSSFPHWSAALFVICFFLPCLCGAEASCHAKERPDGMVTYTLSDTVTDSSYSWLVNGMVFAHEDDYDKALVQDHGPRHLTLMKCQENVAYKTARIGEVIICPYECLRKFSTKEPTVSTAGAPVGTADGAIVGAIVTGAVLMAIIFLVWYERDKCPQWFQARYSPARQAHSEDV